MEQVDPHPVAVAVDFDAERVSWTFCAMEKYKTTCLPVENNYYP